MLIVTSFFLLFSPLVEAKSKKNKNRAHVSRSYKKGKSKNKTKFKKTSRNKKVKRSGNGPDLKTLTTTSPFTENPDNGVNSIETKPGLPGI